MPFVFACGSDSSPSVVYMPFEVKYSVMGIVIEVKEEVLCLWPYCVSRFRCCSTKAYFCGDELVKYSSHITKEELRKTHQHKQAPATP